MLYRKIGSYIEDHLRSDEERILLIEGARQIGKSYIIRDIGTKLYANFIEINFIEDDEGVEKSVQIDPCRREKIDPFVKIRLTPEKSWLRGSI